MCGGLEQQVVDHRLRPYFGTKSIALLANGKPIFCPAAWLINRMRQRDDRNETAARGNAGLCNRWFSPAGSCRSAGK
jgi:hypothetical protein